MTGMRTPSLGALNDDEHAQVHAAFEADRAGFLARFPGSLQTVHRALAHQPLTAGTRAVLVGAAGSTNAERPAPAIRMDGAAVAVPASRPSGPPMGVRASGLSPAPRADASKTDARPLDDAEHDRLVSAWARDRVAVLRAYGGPISMCNRALGRMAVDAGSRARMLDAADAVQSAAAANDNRATTAPDGETR